jgi:ankyrin repeat protein
MASIHDAAKHGDVPGVQAKLQAGVNPDLRDGGYECTALHWAADKGHAAVVGALVGGGATVGAVSKSGWTALHFAAQIGHAAVVEALAGAGAGVDAAAKDGHTPLSLAAVHGQTEAAAALLGAGADATRPTDKGKTAAEWAREKGHPAVARLIEDHLAQPEPGSRGPMAFVRAGSLHAVANRGDVPGVQAALKGGLFKKGVDPDLRDWRKWTALHYAAEAGHAAVVGALVGGGAAVDAVEHRKKTALHLAAEDGHAAVVEALVGAGAGVEAADEDGHTALHFAAVHGQTEAAAALLGAGADATRPTLGHSWSVHGAITVAEWALERGHVALAQLIADTTVASVLATHPAANRARAAAALAAQARDRGLRDVALMRGTRVRVDTYGEGVYQRWEENTSGSNSHYIQFGAQPSAASPRKVQLKKLKPEMWSIVPEPVAGIITNNKGGLFSCCSDRSELGIGGGVRPVLAAPPSSQQQQTAPAAAAAAAVAQPEPATAAPARPPAPEPRPAPAPAPEPERVAEEGEPPPLAA